MKTHDSAPCLPVAEADPEPRAKPVTVRVVAFVADWFGPAANDNAEPEVES